MPMTLLHMLYKPFPPPPALYAYSYTMWVYLTVSDVLTLEIFYHYSFKETKWSIIYQAIADSVWSSPAEFTLRRSAQPSLLCIYSGEKQVSNTSSSRVALSNVELQGRCTYRDGSNQKKGVGLEALSYMLHCRQCIA